MLSMPKSSDPTTVVKYLRKQYPQAKPDKLLRIWEAVVIDHRELQKAIIERAFAAALAELQKMPVAPPPQM